jgi:hypothetical protein
MFPVWMTATAVVVTAIGLAGGVIGIVVNFIGAKERREEILHRVSHKENAK